MNCTILHRFLIAFAVLFSVTKLVFTHSLIAEAVVMKELPQLRPRGVRSLSALQRRADRAKERGFIVTVAGLLLRRSADRHQVRGEDAD